MKKTLSRFTFLTIYDNKKNILSLIFEKLMNEKIFVFLKFRNDFSPVSFFSNEVKENLLKLYEKLEELYSTLNWE